MKKALNILILLSLTLLISACTKFSDRSTTVSTFMEISYQDSAGKDLLDPNTPGYYNSANFHVFKMDNGVKTEVAHYMMDYPHDFLIFRHTELNRYYMRIFLDQLTYIQLNQHTEDTLTSEIDYSHGNSLLKKFWYNGKLYWDDIRYPQRITIIKQ